MSATTKINMNDFKTDEKKRKFYNDVIYMIYGVEVDDLFFIDGNINNLTRDNIVITSNFI